MVWVAVANEGKRSIVAKEIKTNLENEIQNQYSCFQNLQTGFILSIAFLYNVPLFFLLLHLDHKHQKSMYAGYTCYCLMDCSVLPQSSLICLTLLQSLLHTEAARWTFKNVNQSFSVPAWDHSETSSHSQAKDQPIKDLCKAFMIWPLLQSPG